MNEFTLAGAVLADSLGRGADKKNGGEPTHSSPKSATFSKEYNTPAKTRADTVRPGYTTPMQLTGDGELLPYSLCMKVSKFQIENKRKLYFHSKYRLFRCQKVTPRPEGEKKA